MLPRGGLEAKPQPRTSKRASRPSHSLGLDDEHRFMTHIDRLAAFDALVRNATWPLEPGFAHIRIVA